MVVRQGSMDALQVERESNTSRTKARSQTTVEGAEELSGAPRRKMLDRLHRRSVQLSSQHEDRVSFTRGEGAEEEQVWTLSRTKLDALRTLRVSSSSSGTFDSLNSVIAAKKSPILSVSNGALRQRSQTNRLSQIVLPKAPLKSNSSVLTRVELVRLNRTLSDPQILPSRIEEEKNLTEWTEGSEKSQQVAKTSQIRRIVPQNRNESILILKKVSGELNKSMPAPGSLSGAFARREKRIKLEFEKARINPLRKKKKT